LTQIRAFHAMQLATARVRGVLPPQTIPRDAVLQRGVVLCGCTPTPARGGDSPALGSANTACAHACECSCSIVACGVGWAGVMGPGGCGVPTRTACVRLCPQSPSPPHLPTRATPTPLSQQTHPCLHAPIVHCCHGLACGFRTPCVFRSAQAAPPHPAISLHPTTTPVACGSPAPHPHCCSCVPLAPAVAGIPWRSDVVIPWPRRCQWPRGPHRPRGGAERAGTPKHRGRPSRQCVPQCCGVLFLRLSARGMRSWCVPRVRVSACGMPPLWWWC
jgi:hypothetical protein